MEFTPPKLPLKFLRWYCRKEFVDEIEGDLHEIYVRNYVGSSAKAKAMFFFHVLLHFRPEFMKSFQSENKNLMFHLLRHNVLVALRNAKKYPGSFLINLLGLSTGLACTLMIYLWVHDEIAIDKFQDPQIFLVMENRVQAHGIWTAPSSTGLMAESMAQEFPEVAYATTVRPIYGSGSTLSVGDKNFPSEGRYASNDFFKVFSYPLIEGDVNTLLVDKRAIVISENLAKSIFGGASHALGKEIDVQHSEHYHVTGVFSDVPDNASERFDFVLSFEELRQLDWMKDWRSTGVFTFVSLKPGTDVDSFNKKIANHIVKKTNGEITYRTPFVKSYADLYLNDRFENGVNTGGRIDYVRLFSIIAVVILVIACINFMNLSTAKASRRMKEIGVKKSVGAGRSSLIAQYFAESMLIAFISFVLGLIWVILLLPSFNELAGKHLTMVSDPSVIYAGLALLGFTGIAAGSYPALYLSAFKPSLILQGASYSGFSGRGMMGEGWARKGLVVLQFAISVVMIVSVTVVYKQIDYIQTRDLGYDRDNVIIFRRQGQLEDQHHFDTFLNELRKQPGVVRASGIGHSMIGHNSGTWHLTWPGKDPENHTEFENIAVDYGALETLEIKLVAGRAFDRSYGADSSKIIFNEAGIKFMGITDPIGKTINLWDEDKEIIGVVKDFNFQSLHEIIKPAFFRLSPGDSYRVMAKIDKGKEVETIARIKSLYETQVPGFALDYSFLDQNYQKQYSGEQRVATLSRYFAGLAILISCLGLFGLASFTTERRIKEIGIRKVLGSSRVGIIYLLTSEFTKMVLLAIVVALPISYFLTKNWLSKFAFRIDLEAGYFIVAGLTVLLVAWITVAVQTARAARVNPAVCLKTE